MTPNQNTLYNPPPVYSVASENYVAPNVIYSWWLGIAFVGALVSSVPSALLALANNGRYGFLYEIVDLLFIILSLVITAVGQGFLLNRAGLATLPAWAGVTFGTMLLSYLLSYGLNFGIIGLTSNSDYSASQMSVVYGVSSLVAVLLGAIIVGVGQSLVLQRRVRQAFVWAVAYVIARLVFAVIGNVAFGAIFSAFDSANLELDLAPTATITAVSLLNSALWSLVIAAIMGSILLYLLRNRRA